MNARLTPAIILTLLTIPCLVLAGSAQFDNPGAEESADGYFILRWGPAEGAATDGGGRFQLAMHNAQTGAWDVIREGDNTQTFISGLLDGEYRFRVRYRPAGDAAWGEWSDDKAVTVAHHPLGFALSLFVGGGIIFVLTAAFIMQHQSRSDRSRAGGGDPA